MIFKVQTVNPEGKHGPYAICTLPDGSKFRGSSLTFLLHPSVWKEDRWPGGGHEVHVTEDSLEFKNGGWRAMNVRFAKPVDYPEQ